MLIVNIDTNTVTDGNNQTLSLVEGVGRYQDSKTRDRNTETWRFWS
jgi:hypothetical protein